jgi:hypothetical protein
MASLVVAQIPVGITADDLFSSLKTNSPTTTQAIFTVSNPDSKILPKEAININFVERCGKVRSYEILMKSVCIESQPTTEILKVCEDITDNKTLEKVNVCHDETRTIYKDNTFECYKKINNIPIGNNDYKIIADIQYANCGKGFGYNIEWIPEITIEGTKYVQNKWAWWNQSYSKKRLINCTNIADNTPIMINGSAGLQIDGYNQTIWTLCEKNLSIYYNNATSYIIANLTSNKPFEIEFGNVSSNNPTLVWINNYVAVYHMNNGNGTSINDSTQFARTGTATSPVSATYGVDQGSLLSAESIAIPVLGVNNIDFTLEWNMKIAALNNYRVDGFSFGGASNRFFNTFDNRTGMSHWLVTGTESTSNVYGANFDMFSNAVDIVQNYALVRVNNFVVRVGGSNDTGNINVSRNGTYYQVSYVSNGTWSTTETGYCWGCAVNGNIFSGTLFDLRFSNVTRSNEYKIAVARNYNTTIGYGNIEAEENYTVSNSLIIILLDKPEDNNFTTDTTPTFSFTMMNDILNESICVLFVNNTALGINETTQNNTLTYILSNNTLGGGSQTWYINCSDDTSSNISEIRNITILLCSENWTINYGNCIINDTMLVTYTDNNQCGTTYYLPTNNGTYNETCNYCSANVVATTGDCGENNTKTTTYTDLEFVRCCYITNIISDCPTLYSPYNESLIENCTRTGILSCTNTTQEFNCSFDPYPILHEKMNVVCEMPNNQTYCCVANIIQNGNLLATTPEYREASDSLFNIKGQGETRLCFIPQQRLANIYYTPKNLRTDTPFTLEILCTSENQTIKSQFCIQPVYDKPDSIINRMIWARENSMTLIIIILLSTIFLGIIIYYARRLKRGY